MALTALDGSPIVIVGGLLKQGNGGISTEGALGTIDATNEALMFICRIQTDDGGSHTIDTTGSSSMGFQNGGTTTINDAATTVKIGLAAVDATTGNPPRAANAANVITFDVSRTYDSADKPTADTWSEAVPDAGTKTIANGDLVAFCIQMTNRGGVDTMSTFVSLGNVNSGCPTGTTYLGATYATNGKSPNFFLTFSDGHFGWPVGGVVFSTRTSSNINSGSTPNEIGNVWTFPVPLKIYGIYAPGISVVTADCDYVLYSDPLGTPVAEKTISVVGDTTTVNNDQGQFLLFPTPYQVAANATIAAICKPTTTNNAAYVRVSMNSTNHQDSHPMGQSCYAVTRSGGSGAFAALNSSKDRAQISLLVGAFDIGGNNPSYQLGI